MTVKYASDLHLELAMNSIWLGSRRLLPPADILVLAGDIIPLGDEKMLAHPFFDWCEYNFNRTYIVPGDLEFSRALPENIDRKVRSNIYYINECSVEIKPGLEIYFTACPSRPLKYNIVVSHFPPSQQCLEGSDVDHWIFGHTGSNDADWRRFEKNVNSDHPAMVLHTNQLGSVCPFCRPSFCLDDVIIV